MNGFGADSRGQGPQPGAGTAERMMGMSATMEPCFAIEEWNCTATGGVCPAHGAGLTPGQA